MMNTSRLRASSVPGLVLVLTALCGLGAAAAAQDFSEVQIAGMQSDVRHEATKQSMMNMGYSTAKGDLFSSPDPNFYMKRMYLSATDHSTFVEIDVWNKQDEHRFQMSMFAHSPENANYMIVAVDAEDDAAAVPTLKKWESKAAQILGKASSTLAANR